MNKEDYEIVETHGFGSRYCPVEVGKPSQLQTVNQLKIRDSDMFIIPGVDVKITASSFLSAKDSETGELFPGSDKPKMIIGDIKDIIKGQGTNVGDVDRIRFSDGAGNGVEVSIEAMFDIEYFTPINYEKKEEKK